MGNLELSVHGGRDVARGDRALDFDGAPDRRQRAGELDEEPVAGGLDLCSLMFWKEIAQQASMFLDQLGRERLIVSARCSPPCR